MSLFSSITFLYIYNISYICMCVYKYVYIYSHTITATRQAPRHFTRKSLPSRFLLLFRHLLSILPSILYRRPVYFPHGYTLDISFLRACYVRAAFVYHSKVLSFRVLVSFSLSVRSPSFAHGRRERPRTVILLPTNHRRSAR